MKIAFRSVIFLALGIVLLTACNPVKKLQNQERMVQLQSVVDSYRKLMRWGYFDQAVQYLKVQEGQVVVPDLEKLARYKVTNYSIAEQVISESEFEAIVIAYIDFYSVDTGIAGSVRDEQLWWFDPETKRWSLGSPMVNFADYVRQPESRGSGDRRVESIGP
ncbi:MAG: hypothetical protein O3C28_01740 [Proteobacteria bacterium]|nr:hypothetical protein [Pseudomonadota bacterium]